MDGWMDGGREEGGSSFNRCSAVLQMQLKEMFSGRFFLKQKVI
jgi:hypothetical protein